MPEQTSPPAPTRAEGRALPAGSRTRRLMVGLVAVVTAATVGGMALMWPGDPPAPSAQTEAYTGFEVVRAEVRSSLAYPCAGTSSDRLPDGTIPEQAQCASAQVLLTSGPAAGQEVVIEVPPQVVRAGLDDGEQVDVARYPTLDGGDDVYAWVDFARDLPLALLVALFALLVVGVARLRGVAALVGLGLAYATIALYMLPALRAGEPALLVALTGSIAIMVVILYLAHGVSLKTTTALLGTVAGLLLTGALGAVAAAATHLTGLSTEDDYQLSFLTGDADLSGIVLCGIVVAGLGVLNDVTITQASAVFELHAASPRTSRAQLFASGMRIGRDHLASTVYTIAFAYAGAALPTLLLIDLYGQPLRQVLTSSGIAEEIVRTVVGAIGLVAAVPLTTAVAVAAVTPVTGAAGDPGAGSGADGDGTALVPHRH